jgi:hypothetical protein
MILVHALHGLACRSQVVSDINNIFVITLSCVFMMLFPPNVGFSGSGRFLAAIR